MPHRNATTEQTTHPAVTVLMVRIRLGCIHFSRELCDAHFPGARAVALLACDTAVLIVPLPRRSAGGLPLNFPNAYGDRVLHAQEFLRARGLPEDFEDRRFVVRGDAICWR